MAENSSSDFDWASTCADHPINPCLSHPFPAASILSGYPVLVTRDPHHTPVYLTVGDFPVERLVSRGVQGTKYTVRSRILPESPHGRLGRRQLQH